MDTPPWDKASFHSKHWRLYTVWKPNLFEYPLFMATNALKSRIRDCRKEGVQDVINQTFETIRDEGFVPLRHQEFTMLRITEKNSEGAFEEDSHRLQLEAREINFETDRTESEAILSETSVYLVADWELAEILRAVILYSDVLLISGGYKILGKHGKCLYSLNAHGNEPTQIVRVSSQRDRMFLVEAITPCQKGFRFKFKYVAERGKTRRTVVQHRDFLYSEVCGNVTKTLAYNRIRWEFPMPIMYCAEPRETYEVLLSPRFQMSPSASPKRSSAGSGSSAESPSSVQDTLDSSRASGEPSILYTTEDEKDFYTPPSQPPQHKRLKVGPVFTFPPDKHIFPDAKTNLHSDNEGHDRFHSEKRKHSRASEEHVPFSRTQEKGGGDSPQVSCSLASFSLIVIGMTVLFILLWTLFCGLDRIQATTPEQFATYSNDPPFVNAANSNIPPFPCHCTCPGKDEWYAWITKYLTQVKDFCSDWATWYYNNFPVRTLLCKLGHNEFCC